ncbi:phosphotransferase [Pseudoalteromonas luteoviolacea]|uniref:Aminoglycoside phosphotransferase domain-containing protein n=1 Tax=Pseudoalteromonas luteoviolacea S4054 TaxID=1129367 RepID=A0A0F6A5R5_9GAMM|nr:phosphotransferase [Pseudoalteromonas luteoviolacea]AOT07127.1 hypothetical protein S4054249_04260 [Pseudoalteromonas luteoviolacea]AOT12044.1 hypothetical protein S40542_04260 [Pseudoalteromonas luteoviolacea]AOT16957.1 hypothetical protein S4054_04260 [Pseudoalteromonas luteoviolacea]KKE81525.1 hypothetical protein N479_22245 [Pseudoalteromonas luteoviolacea S4054]KZN70033.1 hypothetical protein N481_21705 [Pseudoalteromonas luteoviolacea S4047-1]
MRSFDDSDALDALNRLFPYKSVKHVKRLDAGLSNINFYAELGNEPCLLKAFNRSLPETALAIQNKLATQGVTQSVICIDKIERLAVLEYLIALDIPPVLDTELLEVLVKVHHFSSQCNIVLDLAAEVSKASKQLDAMEIGGYLTHKLKQFPADIRYCHNDLVRENILKTSSGVYLIDFEYAGQNDVFFDLAALCCSFELSSSQSVQMLADYFRLQHVQLPSYAVSKLSVYIGIYLVVSIAWYESRKVSQGYDVLYKQFMIWCQQYDLALPRKA